MDDLYFQHHAILGDVVRVRSRVNRAFTKSMEVAVKVEAYNPLSDDPAKAVCSAFFTFVRGDGAPINKVVPASEEHEREYEAAVGRREVRLARRRITQNRRLVLRSDPSTPSGPTPASPASGAASPDRSSARCGSCGAPSPSTSASSAITTSSCSPPSSPYSPSSPPAASASTSQSPPPSLPRPVLIPAGESSQEPPGSPPMCSVPTPKTRHVEGRPSPLYRFGRESCVQMTYLVLPSDANTVGITFGGQIMKWIENAASISAYRHSRQMCANVSVDSLHFLQPCRVGEAVVILSQVNRAFDEQFMEIGITVEAEDLMTGERRHCCSGYTTYAGLGLKDQRVPVPNLVPETDDEIRRFYNAQKRREMRTQPQLSFEDLVQRSTRTSASYSSELPSLRWSSYNTPARPDDDPSDVQ
eukprot:TRINITY_DN1342_c0_g1_i5.p1 TRINITY_DN1342_c0_g1~~TRINITY_DN1342_c0_g1_i5.p1  ORF type:complete len:475 (-),score=132.17 TRINITY_DN1342_c0_g1_i5:312-1556(-)